MVSDAGTRTARRSLVIAAVTLAALTLAGVTVLALAPRADAGIWVLVSCRQPDGHPAPTEGWSTAPLGSPGFYTEGVNTCSQPGGSLVAVSSGRWAQPAGSGYQWRFAVPAGSDLAEGGELQLGLSSPHGIAAVLTSEQSYDSAYQVVVCKLSETCGISGQSSTVAIGHPGATGLYANAICFPFSEGCRETSGVNAQVTIYSALIALESNVSPVGADFSGGLLSPGASGVQDLQFTASVASGPGIWRVAATVDGRPVYDQTPDSNSGKCQSIGTGPAGAPEFLYQQPCKQTVAVSIPVNTSEFETGAHQLAVSVTDAAGNTATVFDQTINTFDAASQTPWNVSLEVAPRHVHIHRRITLTGRVATSPRPADGKLIYLQAREVDIVYRGRGSGRRRVIIAGPWVPFEHLRAKPEGVFVGHYRFRFGGRHHYQFQAVAPQEGGFDAATGFSSIVMVTET
jgi:hypothetical protein